jgi:DNA-binding GntR family transcriptional regulator
VTSDLTDAKSNITKSQQTLPLRTIIYQQLVSDILSGSINAGERLSEADLVERFGVSKTPIREAFIQMEREGYILLKKNVGAVVQKISIRMVEEIFTVVAVLESYATEIVITERKLTKRDIAHLGKLIRTMKAYSRRKKYLEYRVLNTEFHEYFVEKLGNETLKKSVVDLRRRMYSFVSGGLTLPLYIDRYVECHRQILDAAKQNDAKKAATIMRNHLMESRDFIVSTLAR